MQRWRQPGLLASRSPRPSTLGRAEPLSLRAQQQTLGLAQAVRVRIRPQASACREGEGPGGRELASLPGPVE